MKPYVPLPMPVTDDLQTLIAWGRQENARMDAWLAAAEREIARLEAVLSWLAIAVPVWIAAAVLWCVARRSWRWALANLVVLAVNLAWTRDVGRRMAEYDRQRAAARETRRATGREIADA